MEAKRLSIVTPVYNRADCIINCLESVNNQKVPEGWVVEHLVTDDGSSDSTPDKVLEYKKTHPKVKFSRLCQNRGTNGARNEAIARATGKWVVFLDSDDEMLGGAVSTICNTIDRNPDIGHFLFSTDDTAHKHLQYGQSRVMCYEDFLLERVQGDFVHVLKTENLLKFPFDEKIRIFEGIFFLFYFREVNKILFCSDVLFHRNRGREDHVTYTLGMTNDKALKAKLASKQLFVELYSDDYKKSKEGTEILADHLLTIHRLTTLINDKKGQADAKKGLAEIGRKAPAAERFVASVGIGYPIWSMIKIAVRLKRIFKKQL